MSTDNTYLKSAIGSFASTAQQINDLVANDINTLPIEAFRTRLLPVLRQWAVDHNSENIVVWYNLAGGLNKRIRVTDGSGIAFIVPPPFTDVVLPKDRDSANNVSKIDAMNRLIVMKERDGETKEAMALSSQVNMLLSTTPDKLLHSKHIIMLAKIWDYMGLPVQEILAGAKVDLSEYDLDGSYIATDVKTVLTETDTDEEDEISF